MCIVTIPFTVVNTHPAEEGGLENNGKVFGIVFVKIIDRYADIFYNIESAFGTHISGKEEVSMKKLVSLLLVVMLMLAVMPTALAVNPTPQDYDPVGDSFANVNAPYLTSGGGSSTTQFLTSADFASHTITVMNIWDRQCGPCVNEMPYFQQIHEQYASQGVLVVGVSTTWIGATYAQDYTYFVNNGYTYMNVKIDSVITGIAQNNAYLPQTYILDSNGVCIDFIGGGTTYNVLKNKVETYLAQYAPTYYTVTFKDGLTGSTISTQQVAKGSAATAPTPPVHEGYEFVGWDKAFNNVQSNMTVTALYEQSYVILAGDADCNGNVTLSDISMIYLYMLAQGDLTEHGEMNADFDGDGSVGFGDVSRIYMYILGIG